jgi:hypothetical protein
MRQNQQRIPPTRPAQVLKTQGPCLMLEQSLQAKKKVADMQLPVPEKSFIFSPFLAQ